MPWARVAWTGRRLREHACVVRKDFDCERSKVAVHLHPHAAEECAGGKQDGRLAEFTRLMLLGLDIASMSVRAFVRTCVHRSSDPGRLKITATVSGTEQHLHERICTHAPVHKHSNR